MEYLEFIISQFNYTGELNHYEPFGSGHINDTYRLQFNNNYYIHQKNEYKYF